MNNTLENVDFQVNIKLNNGEAIFSYIKNGEPATGGGVVRTETAGNYNLDDHNSKWFRIYWRYYHRYRHTKTMRPRLQL